ncbi:MAG: sulfatase-like hydrolase/transferase [Planctomycetales bacterium]|nr:sulfatase-like hydrolase/transferase [Planctomycetales bacterium]
MKRTSHIRVAVKSIAFVCIAFASLSCDSNASGNEPLPQPNIVHIMVDDLGWQDVGCYYREYHHDEPFYETPHLDRMAQRGIRFMQAYSPSMTCAPSRTAFLTGQYTPRNGVYHVNMGCQIPRARRDTAQMLDPYYVGRIMPDKPVIAQWLRRAGYTTAHVGKWHVAGPSGYPAPIHVGFDFSFDERNQYNDAQIYDANDPKQANFSGLFAQPKDRLRDAFPDARFPLLDDDRPYDSMTDLSQRWIQKVARGDKPFFLNLCPSLVHGPIMTRDRKRLAHYCRKLGIPFPTDPGAISDPDTPGQHNPYYASMVDSVDWIIGQIIQTLETTDDARRPGARLIDNTFVIVSSDNGAAQQLRNWKALNGEQKFEKVSDNAPLRAGKSWAYEGGCRIPLIIMGPGITHSSINDVTAVNLIDLFPTFMAMAGVSEYDQRLALDGCNLLPVILGRDVAARFPDGTPRDTLYFHFPVLNGAFSTIRQGPWKLLKNTGFPMNIAPQVQLYRLYNDDGSPADLSEKTNLADRLPERTTELLRNLDDWLSQYRAGQPYRNANYKLRDLHGQNKVPTILGRGNESDRIWVTFSTSNNTSKVVDAFLLYTVNPGQAEEWFRGPVELTSGRVEATAPPGMTHGLFCLLDENNFLIHSEVIPPMTEYSASRPISAILEDGYAYKPGLLALIKTAEAVAQESASNDHDKEELRVAIQNAKAICEQRVNPAMYSSSMDALRRQILSRENVSESSLQFLNYFPR